MVKCVERIIVLIIVIVVIVLVVGLLIGYMLAGGSLLPTGGGSLGNVFGNNPNVGPPPLPS